MSNLAFDVAVVGAGAAGIAAAVAAARAGAKTVLIDPAPGPAGTAVESGLSSICGLYLSDGLERPEFVNDGLPREIAEALMREDGVAGPQVMGRVAVLPYRGDSFAKVAGRLIEAESGLVSMWGARLEAVVIEGSLVREMTLRAEGKAISIEVGAAIDATGLGVLAGLAGESELESSASRLTPAIVFPLERVDLDVGSRAEMVRVGMRLARAVESGALEAGPTALSLNESLEPGIVTAKLNLGDLRQSFEAGGENEVEDWANGRVRAVVDFLRGEVPGFENCSLPDRRFRISRREGRCIQGRYMLTGEDVLAARRFADAACRGCWPVEEWDGEGRLRYRFPPKGEAYDIPLDSLRSARLDNLYFAGKCMSADAAALASTRVIGCCLATGEAAGRHAARQIT